MNNAPIMPSLPAPGLEFAFALSVEVGAPVEFGQGPGGRRRWVPVKGGTFAGPRLRGRILPGADWQAVRTPEVFEIDARYALETDDGAVISIVNTGLRRIGDAVGAVPAAAGAEVYFRSLGVFETASAKYAWLNRSVFLGTGFRRQDIVTIEFWRVL